jgi:hypothetical protein
VTRIEGNEVDQVLGLSVTSADVRWVLVAGATGEGATLCRDAADVDTLDDVITAIGDNHVHAVGVTWACEAESAASTLLDALAQRGLDSVVAVSQQEAAESLGAGIADRADYREVAVCIVEPDGALVVLVDPDGVSTEQVNPCADDVLALLDRAESRPEAIFVLGSTDDLDSVVESFHGAAVPVITAAEADLALARGAALASARAVNALDARAPQWHLPSRTTALVSVLAAAVVVFVISLSTAVGIGLTPDTESAVAQRDLSLAQAAPQPVRQPPPPAVPLQAAAQVVAETIVEAAPPAVVLPSPPAVPPPPDVPPPAYVPPAPNYPPPPPPPRLRDRIIERIPIIGRFHQPQPYS